MELKTVQFDYFEAYSRKHITFFPAGSEYRWLEHVWNKMIELHLASYTNEIGRHLVIVRFLGLYEQIIIFICLVFNQKHSIAFDEAFKELGISPLRLGQMTGPDHEIETGDEHQLNRSALRFLVKGQRGTVYNAIFRIFGGESGVLLSLLLLPRSDLDYENFDDLYEQYAPVMRHYPLAPDTMKKISVFSSKSSSSPLLF